jgi:hypothetical protein
MNIMKLLNKIILSLFFLFNLNVLIAQNNIDLTNLKFEKMDEKVSEKIHFLSNSKATYIITTKSIYNSSTYIDKCPCSITIKADKISIKCECEDKEIYEKPIEDSFIYDKKNKILKSTYWKTVKGEPILWKLIN